MEYTHPHVMFLQAQRRRRGHVGQITAIYILSPEAWAGISGANFHGFTLDIRRRPEYGI